MQTRALFLFLFLAGSLLLVSSPAPAQTVGQAPGPTPNTPPCPPPPIWLILTPQIIMPQYIFTSSYTVAWGYQFPIVYQGTLTFTVQEDTAAAFPNPTTIYQGTGYSVNVGGKQAGTYYYRVMAYSSTTQSRWGTGSCIVTFSPPAPPTSIVAPATSSTGFYSISWSTSAGAATYELEEDSNWTFSAPTRIYVGGRTSHLASNRPDGTYFYRVRAVNPNGTSVWNPTSAGCQVRFMDPPAFTSVPTASTSGSYTIAWTTPGPGAVTYEVEEDSAWSFANARTAYTGTAGSLPVSRGNGSYCYRVRAVDGVVATPWVNAPHAVTVMCTGSPSVAVPAHSYSGSFTVTWGLVDQATGYEVEEDSTPAFGSPQRYVYNQPVAGVQITGKPNGTYYYRVRGVRSGVASPWTEGGNGCIVDLRGTLSLSIGSGTTGASYELAGATGIQALGLRLSADPVESLWVQEVTLTVTGTMDDVACIDGVRLYADVNGNGVAEPHLDVLLGGPVLFGADNGTVTFANLNRLVAFGSSIEFIATVDLSPNTPPGSGFSLGVADPSHVTVTGTVSSGPQVSGAPLYDGVKTVGDLGTLHVQPGSANPLEGTAPAGAANLQVLHVLAATGSPEAIVIERMAVRVSASPANLKDHLSFSLFADLDRDGVLDPGEPRIAGPVPVGLGDMALFWNLAVTLPPSAIVHWIVAVDVGTGAPDGGFFAATLLPEEVSGTGQIMGQLIAGEGVAVVGPTMTVAGSAAAGPATAGGCEPRSGGEAGSFFLPFLVLGAAVFLARRRLGSAGASPSQT